jgi:hypothetical protein
VSAGLPASVIVSAMAAVSGLAAALPGSFFVSTGGRGNAGDEGASGAGVRLNGFFQPSLFSTGCFGCAGVAGSGVGGAGLGGVGATTGRVFAAGSGGGAGGVVSCRRVRCGSRCLWRSRRLRGLSLRWLSLRGRNCRSRRRCRLRRFLQRFGRCGRCGQGRRLRFRPRPQQRRMMGAMSMAKSDAREAAPVAAGRAVAVDQTVGEVGTGIGGNP